MKLNVQSPKDSINKSYLQENIKQEDFTRFGSLLDSFIGKIELSVQKVQTEENMKNLLKEFLESAFYRDRNELNTKSYKGKHEADLVIHNSKSAESTVGVIFEVKKPDSADMVTVEDINRKAFHETIVYYLQEKVRFNNILIKKIIITDLFNWFIIDASEYNRLFYENKQLVESFNGWLAHASDSKKTEQMYDLLSKIVADSKQTITVTHFKLASTQTLFDNDVTHKNNDLREIYKLLSPKHLLKESLEPDSNELNKEFYFELLYIIGLEEYKDGGKTLIRRPVESNRKAGSLLENTIQKLRTEDCLRQFSDLNRFGETEEEQLFSIGLELCIMWINRILFLKLLEAQLINYHNGNKEFAFLTSRKIDGFDDLNTLFFEVLAQLPENRYQSIREQYPFIPYLNSSLFEVSELEQKTTIKISNLNDRHELPIYSRTVLRDRNGNSLKNLNRRIIEYLMDFLGSFNFGAEIIDGISIESNRLINASVLGKIFEKINGYRDGSFFTPGFITMHMCRETIRRAIVDKFNEHYGWDCKDFSELLNKDYDIKTANEIINSLKICDTSVGSGHFLVSALNEIIACKAELGILCDKYGRVLKRSDYTITVENDELQIRESDGRLFKYTVNEECRANDEIQRVQETIFNEKRYIIENCLFGVDINPKSVIICRLRLWIELLKNAYYINLTPAPLLSKERELNQNSAFLLSKERELNQNSATHLSKERGKNYPPLQTLPNIDINIKQGNSLLSRFPLDADLAGALSGISWKYCDYINAVRDYKNATDRTKKHALSAMINQIKSNFSSFISDYDPRRKRLDALAAELHQANTEKIFDTELTEKQKEKEEKKKQKLIADIEKLRQEIDEERSGAIYRDAFEWRFEFPEVLDENGKFVGFDIVIGNPPYIALQRMDDKAKKALQKIKYRTFENTGDIYALFYERGQQLLKINGILSYITSRQWMQASYGKSLRKFLIDESNPIQLIDFGQVKIFDGATVFVNILLLQKGQNQNNLSACLIPTDYDVEFTSLSTFFDTNKLNITELSENTWEISKTQNVNEKIEIIGKPLSKWDDIEFFRGITSGFNEAFHIEEPTKIELINLNAKNSEIIKPLLRGKDIKRYGFEYTNWYTLFIPWHFPLHNDKSIANSSDKAELAFQNQYPAVYNHLLQYKNELSNRNQTETGIRYEWYALQRYGADFWENYEKPKIVWIEISDRANYAYDDKGMYLTNSAYFLTCKNDNVSLKYLLALLNSKVADYYFSQKTARIAGGRMRYTKQYVERIPIPQISEEAQQPFISLVDQILSAKQANPQADTSPLEREIDMLVYRLYGLTEDEIRIVEGEK
jgi:adenine-specific DNA-methyltransferase